MAMAADKDVGQNKLDPPLVRNAELFAAPVGQNVKL